MFTALPRPLLTGNAKIKLFNAAKTEVTKINDPKVVLNNGAGATLSESIIENGLAANTYYVEVSLEGTATQSDYTLSVLTSLGADQNIFWRNGSTSVSWSMNGTAVSQGTISASASADWQVVGSGNFNGASANDLGEDLVLVNRGTGADRGKVAIWLTDGAQVLVGSDLVRIQGTQTPLTIPDGWSVKAIADFNGDGNSDLLWANPLTGQGVVWLMEGATYTKAEALPTIPGWTIEAVADFDGPDANGVAKADILWRNAATGQSAIWLMDGTVPGPGSVVIADPGQSWQVVGTGDFNADKKADLVWSNSVSGQKAIWLMNGTQFLAGTKVLPLVDRAWTIAGLGDTNGDGKTDLVWRNSVTNTVAVWGMNGTDFIASSSAVLPYAVDANWQFGVKNQNSNFDLKNNQKALVDLNSDGKVDLFWRNLSTSQLVVWTLDGAAIRTSTGAGDLPVGEVTYLGTPVRLGADWQNSAFLKSKLKQVAQSTAGTSRATAFDLGTIKGDVGTLVNGVYTNPSSYVDNVGAVANPTLGILANPTDDYKFTVGSDYLVNLAAVNPIAGAAAPAVTTKLYRVGGTAAVPTYTLTSTVDPIPAGTYIIEVTPNAGAPAVDYKLNLTAVEPVVELAGAPVTADLLTTGFSVTYPTGTSAITLAEVGTTPITLNYKVQNTGNYSAQNIKVAFYLSKDSGGVIDPTDKYNPVTKSGNNLKVGQAIITTIAAGVNNAAGGSIILQLPAGDDDFWDRDRTYEIGMVVNPTQLQDPDSAYTTKKETLLTDNLNVLQGRDKSTLPISNIQKPDLIGPVAGPAIVGASASRGAVTTVNYTITNAGKKSTDGLAPNFNVSFYLLTGTQIVPSAFDPTTATLLKVESYDNLLNPLGKAGSTTPTFSGTTQLTIPTTFAETSGYIVMYVDGPGTNSIVENRIGVDAENNNVSVGQTFSIV
jgi:FG-GAP-like repeat/FG-GAP repeat